MAKIISEYQSQEMSQSDDSDYLAFLTHYHARALADMLKGYVSQDEPKLYLPYFKQLILASIR